MFKMMKNSKINKILLNLDAPPPKNLPRVKTHLLTNTTLNKSNLPINKLHLKNLSNDHLSNLDQKATIKLNLQ